MSSLGALLDEVRDYYLTRFAAAVREHERAGARVITETPMRNAAGEVVTDGPLALPMRIDLVALPADGGPPRSLLIDTEKMLAFEPVSFTWEGQLAVCVEPFQWNGCVLDLEGSGLDLEPLRRWFLRWFDRPAAPDGPWQEVVHDLSDPEVNDERRRFRLDLGSAPVDAFEELLDAARETGAADVRVHAS